MIGFYEPDGEDAPGFAAVRIKGEIMPGADIEALESLLRFAEIAAQTASGFNYLFVASLDGEKAMVRHDDVRLARRAFERLKALAQ